MKKEIAYSSLFLMTSVVMYLFLFFVYGDIKLHDLNYAGDDVPLSSYNIIERKIAWNNKQFIKRIYLKGQEKSYKSNIIEALKLNSLESDLYYIPLVESSLNPNAVSEKWAVWMWQLMPETARSFWMHVNDSVDERYDPDLSRGIAIEYLISLYDQFWSWTLATAAYNMWPTSLSQLIEQSYSKSFYDLGVSNETKNYIYKILAFKYGR